MKHGIRFESSSVQRLLSTALELSINVTSINIGWKCERREDSCSNRTVGGVIGFDQKLLSLP